MATGKGIRYLPKMDWSKYDIFPGSFEKCTILTAVLTNIGLYMIIFLSFVNYLLFKPKEDLERNREGYAYLYNKFETLFLRYSFVRVKHCISKPICSSPGAEVTLKERCSLDKNWTFSFTGEERRCINLGSYSYLGFAEGEGGSTYDDVVAATRRYVRVKYDVAMSNKKILSESNSSSAMVVGMGFAANALIMPGLLGPETLVLSDACNHSSLILGMRLARATIRIFRHNDVKHLEQLARAAIVEGKWKKIVIVVEGVYSMEGSICPLKAIIALKKSLGLQIYIDEAHSMGALGPRGRGITDHAGVDVNDVDVFMGTFSKSFGSAGGYIAGSAKLISWVRSHGHAETYAHAMSPVIAQKTLSAIREMDTPLGRQRVRALRENTHYFRDKLNEMGVVLYGHQDSAIVPMLVYSVSKMTATVERLTALGIAAVGVAYPVTPLYKARIRFSLSASHSRAQLDECIQAIRQVTDELGLRYSRLNK